MDFKIVQYTGTGEQVVGSGSIEGDKLQFETADFELDIELRRIIRQGYVHRLVQGESVSAMAARRRGDGRNPACQTARHSKPALAR